jgi:glycerophosphoryl diester phosphodiesterase
MAILKVPPVIGHRGACGYAPENTLVSFKKAASLGAQWVEFDVKLSHDGELVVFHDDVLDRTTNGTGLLEKYSYQELAQLDAGSWFDPIFRGEKIPTLANVITCLEQHGLQANIEIKPNKDQEEETAIKTVNFLNEHWPAKLALPLISSFSFKSLVLVHEMNMRSQKPSFPIGLLLDHWDNNWMSVALVLRCASIHCKESIITKERAKQVKDEGYKLLVYTINQLVRARELWSLGVDSVFSDFPDRLFGQDKS